MISAAIEYCKAKNLIQPVAEQPEYSMIMRSQLEESMRRVYKRYSYGNTVFSPLAGGLLTGKYNDGIPEDSRYGKLEVPWFFENYFSKDKEAKNIDKLR